MNMRTLFPTVLQAENFKIRCWQFPFLAKASCLGYTQCIFTVPLPNGAGGGAP